MKMCRKRKDIFTKGVDKGEGRGYRDDIKGRRQAMEMSDTGRMAVARAKAAMLLARRDSLWNPGMNPKWRLWTNAAHHLQHFAEAIEERLQREAGVEGRAS